MNETVINVIIPITLIIVFFSVIWEVCILILRFLYSKKREKFWEVMIGFASFHLPLVPCRELITYKKQPPHWKTITSFFKKTRGLYLVRYFFLAANLIDVAISLVVDLLSILLSQISIIGISIPVITLFSIPISAMILFSCFHSFISLLIAWFVFTSFKQEEVKRKV